jgi:hypothetical protein
VIASLSSGALRRHAMESLAAWSKFTGSYEQWQQIKRRYSLHWTNGNESLQTLQRFFNPDLTLEIMIQKVRQMIDVLPPTTMAEIVKFGCLVGLRSAEICESVRLINDKETFAQYYDPVQQSLLHYKFKQFLRTTKKAWISFITKDQLSGIANLGPKTPSWTAIRSTCRRRHVDCSMRYCRKIHATYLHQQGIPADIIDALQGRTPASIFAKHYYRPSLDYRIKVLDAIDKLKERLES